MTPTPHGGTDVQTLLLPIAKDKGARGRKGTRALLRTLSARVGCRVRSLLKNRMLPRGHTNRLSSRLLLPSWSPRPPLGRAIGHPMTFLPTIPETVVWFQIAITSTQPLYTALYSSCLFLVGTAHSRDSTFCTRLNAGETIGLLNSCPGLRRFPDDRVHEIWVLLPAPLHVDGSRNLSFELWRV